MRNISKQAAEAFNFNISFKKSNTEVIVAEDTTTLLLHGNVIAYKFNNEKVIRITTCGWNTPTTKERLNALNNVHVYTSKGVLYLNGKEWDGSIVGIPF